MENVVRMYADPVYDNKVIEWPKQRYEKEHPVDAATRMIESSTRTQKLSSKEEINQMVSYMLDHNQFRDACFFVIAVNVGLRPSDNLRLRWGDMEKESFPILESKTGKPRMVYVNQAMKEAVDLYKQNFTLPYRLSDYMFVSLGPRTGHVPIDDRTLDQEKRTTTVEIQPVNIRTVSRTIRNAARALGIYTKERRISAYSTRKTALSAPTGFVSGYSNSEDLLNLVVGLHLAQAMGNHASISTTNDHYTDLQNEVLRKSILEMNLGLEAIQEYKNKKENV